MGQSVDTSEDIELFGLLDLGVQAATQASQILLDGIATARSSAETKTTGTDMVTAMDRASEETVVSTLLGARPDDGILGEEGTDVTGTSGVRWIIDPLDGTTNYLYGHTGFNISIAAERDGIVVAAVVLDPIQHDLFTAVLGHGARRNGALLAVSDETDLGNALVATGFSYEAARREKQAVVLQQVISHIRDIRRMGAAAIDLCSVACGRVDAYYERGLQSWDHAAGGLIAREAGAVVSSLHGPSPEFDFTLAAPPALHGPLRELLLTARADEA
jgi:myo-inositol-1(or 4)-monophosphatase